MNLESINCNQNLNKELAYLFGVYLTDGNIRKDGVFQLQVIDKDFAEMTLNCIKKIKPNCNANIFERGPGLRTWNDGKISKEQKKYCISVGFANLKEFFEKQTNNKHHIPYLIWKSSLQIKKWFIAGIMDGDGYVCISKNGKYKDREYRRYDIGVGKTEEGWILEFKDFLQKMGIKMRKEVRQLSKNGIPIINIRFKSGEFIENGLFFTINRKQKRIQLLREAQRPDAAHPTG